MSLRAYLTFMGLATVLAAATFLIVLFSVDSDTVGMSGLILFYASLFLTIIGLLSLFGLLVRVALHRHEPLFRLVAVSFRHSVLFGILVVGALALRAVQLITWWNSLIMIAVLTLVEFMFLSLERRPVSPTHE